MRKSSFCLWSSGGSLRAGVLPVSRFVGVLCAALLLASTPARADGPDDEYVRIYRQMEEAETLETGGQTAPALAKYQQIHQALRSFQKNHPTWDPKLVNYRLKSVADKAQALTQKLATPAPAPAATNAPAAKPDAGAAAGATSVKLLEAGAEPRKALRLHSKAGDKQTVVFSVKQSTEMGGLPNPAANMPVMEFTLELTVKKVADDGAITYDWTITDAGVKEDASVPAPMVQAIKAGLAGVKGLAGAGTITSRGVGLGTETKSKGASGQAMKQMEESFSHLTLPLPEEAVGLGAKWEEKSQNKIQGISVNTTTTYQLTSLEGEQAGIKISIIQNANAQKFENPGMPGLKMDLTKWTGTGSGTTTVNLGLPCPVAGSQQIHANVTLGMDVGGQKQSMTMKYNTDVNLTSK